MTNWKWKGVELDKLTNMELEDAFTKTLDILCAMHRELQGRREKYRAALDREAESVLQSSPMRKIR